MGEDRVISNHYCTTNNTNDPSVLRCLSLSGEGSDLTGEASMRAGWPVTEVGPVHAAVPRHSQIPPRPTWQPGR